MTKPREMLVDAHVQDLATFWLSSDDTVNQPSVHDKRVMSLAQAIQQAVEDWCEDEADEPPRDEAYERAAAKARLNDFADSTGRKDWT